MKGQTIRGELAEQASGRLTMAFQRASVAAEVASTPFRFPETKSAHLKFSPLSDNNPVEVDMFARNVTFRLKSNEHSDYTQTLESDVLPLLRKQKGFKDEITLSNPGSADAISISLWDSKANADAYNTNTYPEVLRTFAKMIDGTPKVQTFEAVASTYHNALVAA
jgi:hypothetical protein